MDNLSLVEIVDLDDRYLLPWLDLYETAFPPNERVLVSYQLRLLKDKMAGRSRNETMLAILRGEDSLAGLVQYHVFTDLAVTYLWYLAIQPNLRSLGLGASVYQELCKRSAAAGCKAVLFEVEIPEEAESPEGSQQAERRIGFYRRQGARMLGGIEYFQVIGWHQPPTPMHIMVQPLSSLDPKEAYQLAESVFEDSIRKAGSLTLE